MAWPKPQTHSPFLLCTQTHAHKCARTHAWSVISCRFGKQSPPFLLIKGHKMSRAPFWFNELNLQPRQQIRIKSFWKVWNRLLSALQIPLLPGAPDTPVSRLKMNYCHRGKKQPWNGNFTRKHTNGGFHPFSYRWLFNCSDIDLCQVKFSVRWSCRPLCGQRKEEQESA